MISLTLKYYIAALLCSLPGMIAEGVNDCILELQQRLGASSVITYDIPPPYLREYENIVPAAMVFPRSGDEVAVVLNVALKNEVVVAVRSHAGHSYIAQSTMDGTGIVMSLMYMNSVNVYSRGAQFYARVGGGTPLLEAYSRLAMNDPPLGINGGSCPSVAVGGLISGGGMGMSSTFGGFTSDRVVGAKVVAFNSAIGSYIEQEAHDELLFALRGGMGGNYGVVTEWNLSVFEVGAEDRNVVYSFKTVRFDTSDESDRSTIQMITREYMDWLRNPYLFDSGDRNVWGTMKFLKGGVMSMNGQCTCYGHSDITACTEKCKDSIKHLMYDAFGCDSGNTYIASCDFDLESFGEAMWTWAGCTAWAGIAAYPPSGLQGISEAKLQAALKACYDFDYDNMRGPYIGKSLFMPTEDILEQEGFSDVAFDVLAEPICQREGVNCLINVDLVAGAMVDPPSGMPPSALGHRTPGFHIQPIIYWPQDAEKDDFEDWARGARRRFFPLSLKTSYQNYIDRDLTLDEWATQYFPEPGVFERLIAVKCKYNPTPVLNVPHALSMMIPQSTCDAATVI